jgi:hypothetical protein
MTENGTVAFPGTTRNALNLGSDNERLDQLIEMLPEVVDYRRRNIPNITKDAIRKIRGSGVGYYTFRFNHLFGTQDNVFICRLETLRQDLIRFFEGIGAATDELRDYVLCSDKQNTAEHLHYASYYTPDLAELVSIRDRQLIDRFRYKFEPVSSTSNKTESITGVETDWPNHQSGSLTTRS